MVLVDAKDNIVVDVAGYSQKTKAHVNMVSNDNHKLQIQMGWLAIVLQIHKFHLVRLLDVKYIVSVYTTYILTITYITSFFFTTDSNSTYLQGLQHNFDNFGFDFDLWVELRINQVLQLDMGKREFGKKL